MKVRRAIGDRALSKETLLEGLNSIVVPTLRELLRNFNAMTYETAFTSDDVSGGVLEVVHGLDADIVAVTIADNTGALRVYGDGDVLMDDTETLSVDVSGLGAITGTWRVLVQRG